jgi:MAP/microtubule affinity-regulating kinase
MKDEEPDLDKDFIINNIYKIQYEMGKGGYGKVYLVQNIKDGKNYALKVLLAKKDKEKHKQDFLKEINTIQELKNELKKLNKLNESYILNIYNFGKFITNDKIERLYFVMDYAEQEDLLHYTTVNGGLGEEFGKILFKKILERIQFCHNCNYCHFDIKVSNILLDNNFKPIVIDFGFSQQLKYSDKEELIPYKGIRGTPNIMCPQMFEKEKTYNGIDADIFALGVLLFHLVFGLPCFSSAKGHSYQYIKKKIMMIFGKENLKQLEQPINLKIYFSKWSPIILKNDPDLMLY